MIALLEWIDARPLTAAAVAIWSIFALHTLLASIVDIVLALRKPRS